MNWKSTLSWRISLFFAALAAVGLWVLWAGKGPRGEFPRALFLLVFAVFLALGMMRILKPQTDLKSAIKG